MQNTVQTIVATQATATVAAQANASAAPVSVPSAEKANQAFEGIRQHLEQPGSRIVIHHGYGQTPLLQAEELRAWLMTLAVDAARISLLNDVKPNEALKIEVVK